MEIKIYGVFNEGRDVDEGYRIVSGIARRYDYDIGETVYPFTDEVNRLIKEGWKPKGGVIFVGESYTQAMVKEDRC
jgi:hypothetical protein